jgi:hypothetical protein
VSDPKRPGRKPKYPPDVPRCRRCERPSDAGLCPKCRKKDIQEKRVARANATPEQRAREAERRRKKRQEAKLDASRSGM